MAQTAQEIPRPRTGVPTVFEGIGRWMSDFWRRRAVRAEVADLERIGVLDPLLEDLGVTRWEVNKIARGYPETERLLPSMAYHLDIDLAQLDASTLCDLRHTCAICDAHRACRHWLAAGGGKDEARFCPNAALFTRLRPASTQRPAPPAVQARNPSTEVIR